MFPGEEPVRILMYSHDTYGLGHLTRTLRIARAIRNRTARASILILTGSPVAPYLPLPADADLVKLPSVLKMGAERYESRHLAVNFSRIKRLRREVIRSTAQSFRPHMFLVDNVPLGMKGEILPTLRLLRKKMPHTRIILNLRDILDDPEVIRTAWTRDGVYGALSDFYDQIYVLGDAEVFDAVSAYSLPKDRSLTVGYATPSPTRIAGRPRRDAARRRFSILLTAGGGGDGFDLLSVALKGVRKIQHDEAAQGAELDVEVVTGPLMDPDRRKEIAALSDGCGARMEEFIPDLPGRMAKTDLVFAMTGYNTSCDLLTHGTAAVLHPRTTPRVEQLIRAMAFEERGLTTMLAPDRLDPDAFAETAWKVLSDGRGLEDGAMPRIGGLETLADHLVTTYLDRPAGLGRTSVAHRPHRADPGGPSVSGLDGTRIPYGGSRPTSEPEARHVWYWPERVAGGRRRHG